MPPLNNQPSFPYPPSAGIPRFTHRLLLIGSICISSFVSAKDYSLATIHYHPSDENFANPERGFYRDGIGSNLSSAWEAGHSLVMVKLNLLPYTESDIPESHLDSLRDDFRQAREAGFKVIFRAAYGFTSNDYESDPEDMDRILGHIAQFADVLNENQDVLYVVQAGLLGPWGEWHGSNWGSTPSLYSRKSVLTGLLNEIDPPTFVEVRRPMFIRDMFSDEAEGSTLTRALAYGKSHLARTGGHNDAILSGATDMGTYAQTDWSRTDELEWSSNHNRYTPFGGESAALSDESLPDNAIYELQKLHASYLHSGYHPDVRARWQNSTYQGQNTYEYIGKHLGYRFVAEHMQISEVVRPGGILRIHLELRNVGFSSPHLRRDVNVVLQQGKKRHIIKLPEDPRNWDPDEGLLKMTHQLELPKNLNEGTWQVHLHLADPNPYLADKGRFSIRLANSDIPFSETTGYNTLSENLIVARSGKAPTNANTRTKLLPRNRRSMAD